MLSELLEEEGGAGGPLRAQSGLPTGRVRSLTGSGRCESADPTTEVSTVSHICVLHVLNYAATSIKKSVFRKKSAHIMKILNFISVLSQI